MGFCWVYEEFSSNWQGWFDLYLSYVQLNLSSKETTPAGGGPAMAHRRCLKVGRASWATNLDGVFPASIHADRGCGGCLGAKWSWREGGRTSWWLETVRGRLGRRVSQQVSRVPSAVRRRSCARTTWQRPELGLAPSPAGNLVREREGSMRWSWEGDTVGERECRWKRRKRK